MRTALAAATLLLALTNTRAHADPSELATQPFALATRGVAVSYEALVARRWSVAGMAGARLGAEGDYDSSTLTVGADLRWWPRRRTPMRGPFVGVHASVGRTTVSDDMGTIGASLGLTQVACAGWRWVIAGHLALAPSLGAGTIEDVDELGRLATTVRPTVVIGFELGWWSP